METYKLPRVIVLLALMLVLLSALLAGLMSAQSIQRQSGHAAPIVWVCNSPPLICQ